jgi:hypothetical protein
MQAPSRDDRADPGHRVVAERGRLAVGERPDHRVVRSGDEAVQGDRVMADRGHGLGSDAIENYNTIAPIAILSLWSSWFIARSDAAGIGRMSQRPDKRLVLVALLLAAYMINLDTTIVNVALPTLVRELHASTVQLEWIVDAYNMMFAAFVLAAGNPRRPGRPQGRAADRTPRRALPAGSGTAPVR